MTLKPGIRRITADGGCYRCCRRLGRWINRARLDPWGQPICRNEAMCEAAQYRRGMMSLICPPPMVSDSAEPPGEYE